MGVIDEGKRFVRGLAENALGKFGFELRREPSFASFLKARDVDLVIDVGANVGQFARRVRKAGYRGQILSFEPVGAVHAKLARRAAADGRWQTIRSAVGERSGEVTIHVSHHTEYSSIKGASDYGVERDSNMAGARDETVPLMRLDDVPEVAGYARPFLKIDTQGYERNVLDGAAGLLPRLVGLQLELPLVHIYEDVWNFAEAVSYMDSHGFVPAQFRGVSVSDDATTSSVEVDCVFRKKEPSER